MPRTTTRRAWWACAAAVVMVAAAVTLPAQADDHGTVEPTPTRTSNPVVATPQDVRLVAAGTELRLTWTTPTGSAEVTSYQVQVDDEPVQSTRNTWYNRLELATGEHTIRVRAQSVSGTSTWVERTVDIPAARSWPTTVPTPVDLTALPGDLGYLRFDWRAPAGEPEVVAYETQLIGPFSGTSRTISRSTAMSIAGFDLPPGRYTAYVRSVAADGSVSPWVSASATMGPTSSPTPTPTVINPIIQAPQDVRLVAAGTELRLTWTKPTIGADITSYEVQVDGSEQTTDATWFNAFRLAAGEHTIRVRSVSAGGTSAWVEETVSIPAADSWPTTVPVPADLTATLDSTRTGVRFDWAYPTGPPRVVAFETSFVGSNGYVTSARRVTDTSSEHSGMPPGSYRLHVRSVAADGSVSPWIELAVSVGPAVTPSPTPTTRPPVCAVTYTAHSWNSGFTASVRLKNTGTTHLTWNLSFDLTAGQQVQQGWSARWAQTGTTVTATGAAWNATLPPGASVDLGFNGSHTGENPTPTAFAVNGSACAAA